MEAANIARRFVADGRIVATIGSFSSTAGRRADLRAGGPRAARSLQLPSDFTAQGLMFRNVNTGH